MLVYFVAGELGIYLAYKIARRDFSWWILADGTLGFALDCLARVVVKIMVDFSGCVHFRHAFEMGGLAFTASLLWAQAFPFVALHISKNSDAGGAVQGEG